MKLLPVPTEQIAKLWPYLEPLMDDACNRSNGKYRSSDILEKLMSRDMYLWVKLGEKGVSSFCVTEITVYPQSKCLRVLCASGSPEEIINHISDVEAWAISAGCKESEIVCRPGWERALKKTRYRKTHFIFNRSLDVIG